MNSDKMFSAKRALPQLHKFLAQYPLPEDVLQARHEDIDEYFKPLGLTTTRSHIVMRFTGMFLFQHIVFKLPYIVSILHEFYLTYYRFKTNNMSQ